MRPRPVTSLRPYRSPARSYAAGLSLVELMISITLGMLVLAALLVVFSNASSARSELDRTSRHVDNARYAVALLSEDLRLSGFYGELDVAALPVPAGLPDPCSTDPAQWTAAMPVHLQGYIDGAVAPACMPLDLKPGSDIVVVRRAKTCAAGEAGCEPPVAGKPYMQANLCSTEPTPYVLGAYGDIAFPLLRKDCATPAALREYVVNIYYVSTDSRIRDNIPTLMRLELTGPTLVPVPLVEGIEALRIEYAIDNDNDGKPDAYTTDPTNYTYAGCPSCTAANNWANVVGAQLYVLTRSVEPSPGHVDSKTYSVGSDAAGNPVTIGPMGDAFRRSVFTSTVRLVNPAARREQP
jgi:type IV pilus assembly protein PilW